ncbi:MAG TPA: GNAT family N-acetyltransferase [Anaerolineales bacterium]|nr:GNAT family N-acetyltransferase [Anaerolineales bacterium]
MAAEKIIFTVRRAEPDDYKALHQIFASPQAVRGTLQLPFPTVELFRKRLTEPPEGTFNLVVCVEDEVIGQLGLHTFPNHPRRRHVGQIGMAVRDDWQGKGAGTALMQAMIELADRWLNLSRLELEVYTDNEPAIRLYKKFDFVIEGTHTDFAYRDGTYVDAHFMARLRK